MLQCVAVCYSVLQHVAVYCFRYSLFWRVHHSVYPRSAALKCVVVCCSVLQCVVVCCSALQCITVCCSVLQCVAACVLQFVASVSMAVPVPMSVSMCLCL